MDGLIRLRNRNSTLRTACCRSATVDGFRQALAAIRDLRDSGIVSDYAVGGAMAVAFWAEPTATFDLDVFVLYQSSGLLVDLGPIYRWAEAKGFPAAAEHIEIAGVPVQIIPAHTALAVEAVENAADLDYDGEPVRVITPEYLIAMYLEPAARTHTRAARVGALLDGDLDRELLADIVQRYNVELPTR